MNTGNVQREGEEGKGEGGKGREGGEGFLKLGGGGDKIVTQTSCT